MGLKSYFAPRKGEDKKKNAAKPDVSNEKAVEARPDSLPPLDSPRPAYLAGSSGSSPYGSRPNSLYRNSGMDQLSEIKCDVMVNWLHSQQEEKLWCAGEYEEGVVLKKARGSYACCPAELAEEPNGFLKAVEQLNVRVAMTVNTRVIKILLHNNNLPYVEIQKGLRVQVLPDISYLPRCQKHQFAAFIADRGILVVWEDQPKKLLERIKNIESALMDMIWQEGEDGDDEKKEASYEVYELEDLEAAEEKPRKTVLIQALITACTMIVTCAAIGSGWREIAVQLQVDGDYIRLAFAAVVIPQVWLSLFFFQALVGNVAQIIGPIGQVNENSKYYSGIAPRRLNRDTGVLPHVTIQCPVYKEGLHSVIEPTIRSIKAAISTYEMQGGTANIFINDDGMQLISEEEAQARRDYYDEHNIGWVARPKHNPKPAEGEEVFLRRGKFKKASNMNYALWVSNRVEEKLLPLHRSDTWTQDDEAAAYRNALAEVVAEDEGRTWADGNIRVGDYILLIDSDTRVPKDCFIDAVSEMEQSPQVGIIQYSSGVMNVTDSFFERGITYFTNLIYTQIRYSVAGGDVAPFVGHNAWLRWSAVQNIAYDCKDDHREKYWSEATVSEDFDMALRLQTEGYTIRLGAYKGDGYKEGVSLTVYDELARWEKYAYGCSELIFHPLRYWPVRGPFTKLFRRFIVSSMPLPSKLTIMAYIGTYYAIGSAWILTLLNYFIIGWFNGYYDHYYTSSFEIYFGIVVVFNALGNVSLGILRYRTEEKALLPAWFECFKWVPLMTCFLGGLSLHVSQAILCHMFSIDMSWGATAKEAENISFFEEIPRVLKRFKYTFIFCIACIALMICGAYVFPPLWQVKTFVAIWPLCTIVGAHLLLPIALNPNLMLFTW
ncbi:putative glycosyl transferase family 2 protein [Lasiodiplodia theobromae]|uniref:Glycosyl transferase family 2 n=1 Tax=Lasiodiplodia theobromae TaxID=45133 RepID=UPI0015C3C377|nr:Glycosyl transferase family 2 [Lasiodiplodia theobromae]KAF4535497.1 Glycosyl transferase family 2 [Lasiodiplodia theobromae]KAF9638776.1 putative glycosyl transferase family 2 protein [Lasiodiplodia theobromae]